MKAEWKEVRLGEVTDLIKRGVAPKYVDKDGYVVINQKCIRAGVLSFDHSRLTSKSKKVAEEKFVRVGDVLINSTGTGTLGRTAPVRKLNGTTTVDTHVTILRGNDKVDKLFLGYLIRHYEPLITLLGKGATNQIELGASDLKVTKVVIPKSKETQRKIASILSAYDDLIENNHKRIKLLEEKAQLTYEEWFVRMKYPGYKNASIELENNLPEGWKKVRASELFDIQGGTQPPKNEWSDFKNAENIRMVQIRDYYTNSHIAYVKKTAKLRVCNAEDIMIARYGASVGRICYGIEGVYNVALVKVMPFEESNREFLRWYLRSKYFQTDLLNKTQRTAQDGFNKGTFKSIYLVLPDEQVITLFNNLALNIFIQVQNLKKQNKLLMKSRDILLPRLMTGMIDVDKINIVKVN